MATKGLGDAIFVSVASKGVTSRRFRLISVKTRYLSGSAANKQVIGKKGAWRETHTISATFNFGASHSEAGRCSSVSAANKQVIGKKGA
jgi:hypothetical protein